MGDRANIVICEDGSRIYLYTHWNGSDLPQTLHRALARNQRWDDPSYLTRIIFCEMVKGEEAGTTGFGISARQQDNEYPLLIVDMDKREVRLEAEADGSNAPFGKTEAYSFEAYVGLGPEVSWETLDPARKAA